MDDKAAYVTGIQDQLSTAAQRGDKEAVVSILQKVAAEDLSLGVVLAEKVVNDSLRRMTR
ncbi:hypothetical protein AB0F17_65730 [Nonomuraea sp. NPDC026600]|uniref:hypothetical protein n=1 Tax=Nonomuraea sp. NPDC026600 TaxID=3155363 RepID=UPI0033C0A92B